MLNITCLILHNMYINTKEVNNCRGTWGGGERSFKACICQTWTKIQIFYVIQTVKQKQIQISIFKNAVGMFLLAVSDDVVVSIPLAARNSNRNKRSVYQIRLCKATIWLSSFTASLPYIPFSNGMPTIKVFGSVDKEKPVISQSNFSTQHALEITANPSKEIDFCRMSENMSFRFMS